MGAVTTSSEKDALTGEQRASLLRVLDWGVESRNMTHETALQVLSIVDNARVTPPAVTDGGAA